MAIMTEAGNVEIAPDRSEIGTHCPEINPQSAEPAGTSGAKRLSPEEQRVFFRNSRNFFE